VKDLLAEVYITEIASNILNDDDYEAAKWVALHLFHANEAYRTKDIKDATEHNKIALKLFNQHIAKGVNSQSFSAAVQDMLRQYEAEIS